MRIIIGALIIYRVLRILCYDYSEESQNSVGNYSTFYIEKRSHILEPRAKPNYGGLKKTQEEQTQSSLDIRVKDPKP